MRHRAHTLCVSFAAALTAAACGGASRAPAVPEVQTENTVRVLSGAGERGGQLVTTSSYRGVADAVDVPVDSAWGLLPAVYTELGVDFTTLDQTNRVIGNDALRAPQRLGKVPLSRYVSCGTDNGRDNADSYVVTMAVRTQLLPGSGSQTTVASAVTATARSLLFNSGDVACASTQRLEDEIAKRLKARVGAGQ